MAKSRNVFAIVRGERQAAYARWRTLRGMPGARQALDELLKLDAKYQDMVRKGEDRDQAQAVEEEE